MDKLIERFANGLIESKTIQEEDKELYTYGLKHGLILALNIITTLLIGLILSMFWQSLFFLILYAPLRTFAGGAHARTQKACYFMSILIIIAVLLIIRYVDWTKFLCLCVALCSGIIIFIFTPVEDQNKPLDDIEIKVYKKRSRIILIVELGVLAVFTMLNQLMVCSTISVSLFTLSITLIMGIIINKRVQQKIEFT